MYNLEEDNSILGGPQDNSILGGPQIGDVPFGPSFGDYPWITWGQQGWVCPKCGRVLSPNTPSCPCSEPSVTYISTDCTVPKFPEDYWNYLNKSI